MSSDRLPNDADDASASPLPPHAPNPLRSLAVPVILGGLFIASVFWVAIPFFQDASTAEERMRKLGATFPAPRLAPGVPGAP